MLTFDEFSSNLITGINLILSKELLNKVILPCYRDNMFNFYNECHSWLHICNEGWYCDKNELHYLAKKSNIVIIIEDFNCKVKNAEEIFGFMLNTHKKFILTIDTIDLIDELIATNKTQNLIGFKKDKILSCDLLCRLRERGLDVRE